jgi:uroporphyrinogen-III synthase
MSSLIERHGGEPISAPSMREIPIEENPEALSVLRRVISGEFDAVILLTGVGAEAIFELARSAGLYDSLLESFGKTPLIIRGPKPAVVLNRLGLKYAVRAPEPNTWRELLQAIDASDIPMQGKNVMVQEYGLPNARLYAELQTRGAFVTACSVYRWALPENLEPLQEAIRQICSNTIDVILFTSANQVSSVLQVADQMGLLPVFRKAIGEHIKVASIGPTCTEALTDSGIHVSIEASPPKMGQLVRAALEVALAKK